jgi:hypothetical protein
VIEHSLEGPRASDADRDRALARLREASADGRLSVDTFLTRVDGVLRATSHREIDVLVDDLRTSRRLGDRTLRAIAGASGYIRRAAHTCRVPWLPPLCLPAAVSRDLTIGRSPDCDLVLSDPTVSRRHARLRRLPQGWEIHDLGSTNGTRVNGWHVGVPQQVQPGDVVSFGALSLAVRSDPAIYPR